MRDQKRSQTRDQLKEHFKNGKIPTATHYEDLIDSMLHKVEDGISKDEEGGLNIHCSGESLNLLSLYPEINSSKPFFMVSKDMQVPTSLKLGPINPGEVGNDAQSFYFGRKGNFGIGTPCSKNLRLEVRGFAGMEGRIGTYKNDTNYKEAFADGTWYRITPDLNNCHGFEVVARTGKKGSGKFALMHAIALSAYGKRGGKIRKTRAHFGFFWNKLNLRWNGTSKEYWLEIRTNSNYGDKAKIYYSVTKLWADDSFLARGEYHQNE